MKSLYSTNVSLYFISAIQKNGLICFKILHFELKSSLLEGENIFRDQNYILGFYSDYIVDTFFEFLGSTLKKCPKIVFNLNLSSFISFWSVKLLLAMRLPNNFELLRDSMF